MVVELRTGTVWEVPEIYWKSIPGFWANHRKLTGLHCRRAGEWDQITVSRGPECMTACTWGERAAKLAQIGGRPARQAPPHQGRNSVRDALWEWKPAQHIPNIVGYVVKHPEPASKSSRSSVDPPQLLHPNPRKLYLKQHDSLTQYHLAIVNIAVFNTTQFYLKQYHNHIHHCFPSKSPKEMHTEP